MRGFPVLLALAACSSAVAAPPPRHEPKEEAPPPAALPLAPATVVSAAPPPPPPPLPSVWSEEQVAIRAALWERCDVANVPRSTSKQRVVNQVGARDAEVASVAAQLVAELADSPRFAMAAFRPSAMDAWGRVMPLPAPSPRWERGDDGRYSLTIVFGTHTGYGIQLGIEPSTRKAEVWLATFTDVVPPGTMPWSKLRVALDLGSADFTAPDGLMRLRLRIGGQARHEDGHRDEGGLCMVLDTKLPP